MGVPAALEDHGNASPGHWPPGVHPFREDAGDNVGRSCQHGRGTCLPTKVSRVGAFAQELVQPLKPPPRDPGSSLPGAASGGKQGQGSEEGILGKATWHLPWMSAPWSPAESSLQPSEDLVSVRSSPAPRAASRMPTLCFPGAAGGERRDAHCRTHF